MNAHWPVARSEFILGGQKGENSRRAEMAVVQGLSQVVGRHALLNLIEQSGGARFGLGGIPFCAEVQAFVDPLGQLNRAAASRCGRMSPMAAGLPLTLRVRP